MYHKTTKKIDLTSMNYVQSSSKQKKRKDKNNGIGVETKKKWMVSI